MIAAPAAGRVFRHATAVGLGDVTPAGRARLDALARWLQDAAWADIVDAGVEDDGVWIVRRLELRVEQAPRFGEALEVATFCSGTGPLWAERRSTVRGAGGAHVETAALWVHLAEGGTRPRPLPERFDAIYGEAANGRRVRARLRHPGEPPAGAAERPWAFRAADLDMAAHVNNAAYWTVIEEELAGAELAPCWNAEMEYRTPGAAGPARIAADGDLRWVAAGDGEILASARLGSGLSGPMARLGRTDLDVFPLCLGGNVFGWTADEEQSFAVLDAYVEAGGDFIDTANSYGNGASETIIGRWMADRGNRADLVVATKVGGRMPGQDNLEPETIRRAVAESLDRLGTNTIDLYYAHVDDQDASLEESLRTFDELVSNGTVRHLGLSNYAPERLDAALELQRRRGLAEFKVLQANYSLVERDFERTLLPVADAWDLAVCPFFSLAMGFLTGKYRPGGKKGDSPRADRARAYLDRGGKEVLKALDEVAEARGTTVAAVALAWLRAHPRVVAPVASARTVEQLEEILPSVTLELTPAELDRLSATTREAA